MAKLLYWVAGGAAAWTGLIMWISNQPLPVELALAGMALVACAWGHSVLFPTDRSSGQPAPARPRHGEPGPGEAGRVALGLKGAGWRQPRPATAPPLRPGELPPLLRVPLEEAARMEARRLGDALTATGLFGPVAVRLEADGTALVSPVLETEGVRVPAELLLRFVVLASSPDGRSAADRRFDGSWPGPQLAADIAARLEAAKARGGKTPAAQERRTARGGAVG